MFFLSCIECPGVFWISDFRLFYNYALQLVFQILIRVSALLVRVHLFYVTVIADICFSYFVA